MLGVDKGDEGPLRAHPSERLSSRVSEYDADLDIAVVRTRDGSTDGLTTFELAPQGTSVEVGEPIRVVAIDFYLDSDTNRWVADQMVLSGVVSRIREKGITFMIDAPLIPGNSGGVVLNTDMRVIGMVTGQLRYGHLTDNSSRTALRSRNVAVHVEAIRAKLKEWGFLP